MPRRSLSDLVSGFSVGRPPIFREVGCPSSVIDRVTAPDDALVRTIAEVHLVPGRSEKMPLTILDRRAPTVMVRMTHLGSSVHPMAVRPMIAKGPGCCRLPENR